MKQYNTTQWRTVNNISFDERLYLCEFLFRWVGVVNKNKRHRTNSDYELKPKQSVKHFGANFKKEIRSSLGGSNSPEVGKVLIHCFRRMANYRSQGNFPILK